MDKILVIPLSCWRSAAEFEHIRLYLYLLASIPRGHRCQVSRQASALMREEMPCSEQRIHKQDKQLRKRSAVTLMARYGIGQPDRAFRARDPHKLAQEFGPIPGTQEARAQALVHQVKGCVWKGEGG